MNKVTPHIFEKKLSKRAQLLSRFVSILLWIAIWTIAAKIIDRELFLPGPLLVLSSLCQLSASRIFWLSVLNSMRNILAGFFLALLIGLILSAVSYRLRIARDFISLPLRIIRTVPVASFIILALLWVSSDRLSMLISFLMVVPIVYENILEGLLSIDSSLLEVLYIAQTPPLKKIKLVYIPSLLPYLSSALSTGTGLAWKSGIAAEVIGISRSSIGNHLNQAKIYLQTPELFAWTITVIIISLIFEGAVRAVLRKI